MHFGGRTSFRLENRLGEGTGMWHKDLTTGHEASRMAASHNGLVSAPGLGQG